MNKSDTTFDHHCTFEAFLCDSSQNPSQKKNRRIGPFQELKFSKLIQTFFKKSGVPARFFFGYFL